MNKDLLKRVSLFSELPVVELEHLASRLKVKETGPESVLFRQGEIGDEFYILIDGKVDVVLAIGTPEEKVIATFGPGEYIGEMSLLVPGGSRSASARTQGATRLWVVTRQEFEALLQRQPAMAFQMVKVISERLVATNNATIQDMQEKNRQLQLAYDDLKAAQEQIIIKERMERELQVAARIQKSILPDKLPESPHFDFGAIIEPARTVGGDFYDVYPLGADFFSIVIGDVADKGVPSAIFMARTHALITAEAVLSASPGEVLQRVNAHLTYLERSDLFVTVFYALLDCKRGTLAYARAGHAPPLILLSNGDVQSTSWKIGQPLGLLEVPILDEGAIHLGHGDMLLLFTDGMTDCRNSQGEPYGEERLKTKLATLPRLSAQEVCNELLMTLKEYQNGAFQDDDLTLLALHSR